MRPKKWQILVGIVSLFGSYILFLFIASLITNNIIICGLIAIFLLIICLWLYQAVFRRFGVPKEHQNMADMVLEAMGQIAKGNFDITLNLENAGVFYDMMKAVNDMAKKLGTLENMRQDFISNVSHEIQSPITSIQGFAALLKTEYNTRYAEIIENEAKRLSALSDNLLKLSSLEQKPLEKIDYRLDKQIESIVLMLEPQWTEKNINIEVALEKTTINADKNLLSQVWVNLLNNAIKFTKDTIEIIVKSDKVIIKDNGIGISKDDQIHIFERFYKADKSRERLKGGNGLGLSIVKKILDLHGFNIEVESEPNKFTQFTISLNRI